MVENNLTKCAKFNTAFCPKSCNMRREREVAMEVRSSMIDDTDDR